MQKQISPAKFCSTCKGVTAQAKYAFFCDYCKKQINEWLQITIFYKNPQKKAKDKEFCSWTCLREYLINLHQKKTRGIGFITLPEISRTDIKGQMKSFEISLAEFVNKFLEPNPSMR